MKGIPKSVNKEIDNLLWDISGIGNNHLQTNKTSLPVCSEPLLFAA